MSRGGRTAASRGELDERVGPEPIGDRNGEEKALPRGSGAGSRGPSVRATPSLQYSKVQQRWARETIPQNLSLLFLNSTRTTYRRCIELCLCEYYSFAVHTVQHQKHLEYCSLHQSTVRCSMTSTPIKSLVDSDNHSFAVMFTVLLTIQSIRHCVGLRSHRGMDIRFE